MAVSPETLVAFLEGELSAEEARRVGVEVANDPSLAAYMESHKTLKARLQAASLPATAPESMEGLAMADAPRESHPALARDAKDGDAKPERRIAASWIPVGTMAVGVGLGVLLALALRPGTEIRSIGGGAVAQGSLARALSLVVSGDENSADFAPARIGDSFFSKDGYFCRNFTTAREGKDLLAGIACREGEEWRIRVLASSAAAEPETTQEPPPPAAVRETLNTIMTGQPLDADGQRAARAQSWLVH